MADESVGRQTRLATAVGWNVSGQSAVLALGLVGAVVTARILGPADRGALGILLTVPNLGIALASFGIPTASGYFASARPAARRALVGNTLLLAGALAALALAAGWMLRHVLAATFTHGDHAGLWVLAAALVPLTFLDWSFGNQLLGQLGHRRYNVVLVASRLLLLVTVVLAAGAAGFGLTGCVVAALGAELAIVVGVGTALVDASPTVDLGLLRETVAYGGRVQAGAIFQLMNYRLDVLILQFFRPLRDVGYYVVAQAMAEIVLAVGRAFQNAVMPALARTSARDEQARATIAGLRGHGIAALLAIVVTAVGAPLVIEFGYGPEFAPAILPTLVLLPAMWFLGSGNVVAADLRGRGRPGLSSILCAVAVAATVVLDLALIPPFGIMGAALASVVAYVVYGVTSLTVAGRLASCSLRSLVVPSRRDFDVLGRRSIGAAHA